MSGLDRDALDRWITGGRFREEQILVTCGACGEPTPVTASTDYGATDWDPGQCGSCGRGFDGDESFQDDEPPEPDGDDRDPGPSDHFDPRIDFPERYSDGPY